MDRFMTLWPQLHQWQKAKVLLAILRYQEYNRMMRAGEDFVVVLVDWFYIHFVRGIINRNDQRLEPPHFTREEILEYAALFYPEHAASEQTR